MTENTLLKTFVYVWPFILIVTIALGFIFNRHVAINYFLGGAVSVMLMSHNYRTTMKAAYTNPQTLRRRALQNYTFRYAFYALILFIVYLRADSPYAVVPVFIGFTAFKTVMMGVFSIQNRQKKRQGGHHHDGMD